MRFYDRISVPPPTWCPECRMMRRFAWRNERFLYRRPDAQTGEMIFSAFPEEAPIKTIAQESWSAEDFDHAHAGRDYNFNKPFFEQFRELMKDILWPSRWVLNAINSDYIINTNDAKDCYLVMSSSYVQNCAYSVWIRNTEDSLDLYNVAKSSLCYETTLSHACSRVFFSTRCENSYDLFLCRDCVGCNNCFGSANLRNKSYCIFNKQYSKEEYAEKITSFGLDSYKNLDAVLKQARKFWLDFPVKYVSGRQNLNTSGDYIFNSKNTLKSYNIQQGENLHFCQNILQGPAKDSYDYSNWGENAEQMYDSILCGLNVSRCRFCLWCWSNDVDLQYSMYCRNSSNLFGCIGLNNKQYCIFNKQYTKSEYEALIPKIITHMNEMPYVDKIGIIYKYGEFFPIDLSPSPYNEVLAQEYFPLDKEGALKRGYFWREDEKRPYKITKQSNELPDRIGEVTNDILNEVIGCAHGGKCQDRCTEAYRLIRQELDFYRRFGLPLPRLCFNCRHVTRLEQRNTPQLYHRQCMCGTQTAYQNTIKHDHEGRCPNKFETTYAPERPEIVYCERCYLAEVV